MEPYGAIAASLNYVPKGQAQLPLSPLHSNMVVVGTTVFWIGIRVLGRQRIGISVPTQIYPRTLTHQQVCCQFINVTGCHFPKGGSQDGGVKLFRDILCSFCVTADFCCCCCCQISRVAEISKLDNGPKIENVFFMTIKCYS